MPTVSTSLQLFDQFSQTLNSAQQGLERVLGIAERFRTELQQRISLEVDASAAVTHVEDIRQRMQTVGTDSAIRVVIDANDVTQEIERIRGQVRSGTTAAAIELTLDPARAVSQAETARTEIVQQIGTIQANIDLQTPDVSTISQQIGSVQVDIQLQVPDASAARSQLTAALSGISSALSIQPQLNVAQFMADIAALKAKTLAEIGTIKMKIQAQLPASLTTMFTDIKRLVMRLLVAIRQLSTVSANTKQLENALERIKRLEEKNNQLQQQFNDRLQQGGSSSNKLLSNIKGMVAAYLSLQVVKGFVGAIYGAVTEQIRSEQRLQSIMSNINGMTQDGIDLVKRRAEELEKTTAIGAAEGMYGQSQLAEYVYDPRNIDMLTESMYNLATETYGVNVSQDNLKQTADLMGKAMMGQIDALSRNGFKLTSILDKAQIKTFKYGTETERAAILVKVLDENQSNLARSMAQTPEGQIKRLNNAWGDVMTTLGYSLLPILNQVVNLIMDNMPQIKTVFVGTFNVIAIAIQSVIQGFQMLTGWVQNHWDIVQPILLAIAMVLIPMIIASLVSMGIAWLAAAWPVLLIVAVIALIVIILKKLGVTTDQILGYVGALFGVLYGAIYNEIAKIWNFFALFIEFFANMFNDPVYSAKKLFVGLANSVLDMVKKIASAIDWVFGSNLAGNITDLQGMMEDWVGEMPDGYKVIERMQEKDVNELAKQGYDIGSNLAGNMSDAFSSIPTGPDLVGKMGKGAWNVDPNINKVEEVGKIKNKVDISSEDLKVMRELAEMKNIQNFVKLTPTVQVKTGDINNGYDVDTVITRITEHLEKEFAASAEGVYGG
ncbi:hypothetical protein [Cohnella abietis]|uniref:Uncharacterized protein n=1 Tax=Cohnella abietis TaxID=2507935 RepID=A0A3T1D1Q8_9BACL|nr:hypothetical protein [Cohnella abietis]BBI32047.1 hypothetical protein KCTCHS21_14460 [Cohnella abietis]